VQGLEKATSRISGRTTFFPVGLFLWFALFPFWTATAKEPPNVLLITIDTLRADHLGCYGYRQIRTPNIDRLAVEGVRFERAYSPVPITLPAHAAIFTGSYPMRTGMHDFSGNRLPSDQPTLASLLRGQGHATAGIVGSAVLDSRFGLNRGFDFYYDHFDFSRLDETNLDAMERPGNVVADQALAWLSRNYSTPFFLWIHLYDPHYPYRPPAPYYEQYKAEPYDGEIAFADAQVGRVLRYIKQRKLYDNTFVIVAGDHGEGLGEHGEKTHGFFIYNSTLHVPLILKLPTGRVVRNKVVSSPVSLIDLLPTVLQVVGLPVPSAVQGKSLLPLALGEGNASSEGFYAETYLPRIHFNWSELRSILVGPYHFIDAPKPELYDLSKDPRELRNLFSQQSAAASRLRSQLGQLVKKYSPASGQGEAGNIGLDPVLMERLKSLGYAAVSGGSSATISNRNLPDPKDRLQMYELVSEAISDSQQGRHRESLGKLRAAEKIEPASLPVRYLEALDYYRLKDLPSAIERFKSALELDPKFALAAYYLGLAQTETGDLDAGMSSFERALALDPTNFSAAYNLGALYLRKNRVEDAVRQFQRAIEVNPNYAQAYEALGQLYLYQGRTKEAVQALERAVELAPNFPKAHYNLGRAYQVDGRAADAQREFSRADALGSRDKLN
jgi:arylsulfatase A-like enzyme/Flp pilus assembly protein TadD